MTEKLSLGFPRINKEEGEKRAFLPAFIQHLSRFADVYVEEGYGSGIGFTCNDYIQGNPRVSETNRLDTFEKDVVIVLRSPNEDEFSLLRPNSILVSMLHYPTRLRRAQTLRDLHIRAISMDSIMDDSNMRLVENMRAVAWNGLESAFQVIEKDCPALIRNEPYRILVIGTGMVGKHAVDAATKFASYDLNRKHMALNGPGAIVTCAGRNITGNARQMEKLMRQTDVLVDACNRSDTAIPIIPNEWIGWLPETAVIADLSVDPYLLDHTPPTVRGIEGIPQGNLDKYIFYPDDTEWDLTVPASIPSENRRAVSSCYSWPGIHPEACMEHYGRQLSPLMEVLLTRPFDELTLDGDYFARALARAKLPEI